MPVEFFADGAVAFDGAVGTAGDAIQGIARDAVHGTVVATSFPALVLDLCWLTEVGAERIFAEVDVHSVEGVGKT
jgi:hypothetical protein